MNFVQSTWVTFLVFYTQKIAAADDDCVTLGVSNVEFYDVEKSWQPRSWVVDQDTAFIKIATCTLLVYISQDFSPWEEILIAFRLFQSVIVDVPNKYQKLPIKGNLLFYFYFVPPF